MLYRKVPVMAGDPVFIPGPPETAQAMQDWLQEYLPQLTGEAQVGPKPRNHTPEPLLLQSRVPRQEAACLHVPACAWERHYMGVALLPRRTLLRSRAATRTWWAPARHPPAWWA